MKIEIDLANLGFHYDLDGDPIGNRTIEEAIVQTAAGAIVHNLTDKIERQLTADIRDKVASTIDAVLVARITEVIEQPIQQTSPWGERQGEPVTIREMIRTRLEKWLTAAPGHRDGFSRDTKGTLTEIIDSEVRTIMSKDMQAAITEAKAQITTDIRTKAIQAAVAALVK